MVIVKSFSVGNGDMFAIRHGSDSFTIIDCCLNDKNGNKDDILNEIEILGSDKSIHRFISTHPDEDHIKGLELLDSQKEILNFYCVENETTKKEITPSFKKYCELRDSDKAFYLKKDCSRKWLNVCDKERGGAGINILFPNIHNKYFQDALINAKNEGSPNNISPIIKYGCSNFQFMWMGDLETDFMNNIKDDIKLPKINFLFATHHGRDSGKVPEVWLKQLKPDLIIIGEASSENLNYYKGYDTITQNTAGDITFLISNKKCKIYVSNNNYFTTFKGNNYDVEDICYSKNIDGSDFNLGYILLDLTIN